MDMQSKQDILKRFSSLPSLPLHMSNILQTINQDDVNFDELAMRISCEPSIVIRLLRVSNSSFYGVPGKISSIQRAIQVIGIGNVKKIVNALAIIERTPIPEYVALLLKDFWQHSITVAVFSDEIANRIKSNSKGHAFTAGLLHNFGQVILATWYPEKYSFILQEALSNEARLIQLEKEYFQLDHAEIGTLIAEQWNFPKELCMALQYHHYPESNDSELAWILYAADIMHALVRDPENANKNLLTSVEVTCSRLSLHTIDWQDIIEKGLSKASSFSLAL